MLYNIIRVHHRESPISHCDAECEIGNFRESVNKVWRQSVKKVWTNWPALAFGSWNWEQALHHVYRAQVIFHNECNFCCIFVPFYISDAYFCSQGGGNVTRGIATRAMPLIKEKSRFLANINNLRVLYLRIFLKCPIHLSVVQTVNQRPIWM